MEYHTQPTPQYGFVFKDSNLNISSDYLTGLSINLVSDALTTLFGAVINLWLLASIVSSPLARIQPRNQLICSIALLHLLKVFYFLTLQILHNAGYPSLVFYYTKCVEFEYTSTFDLTVSITVKYTLVVMCGLHLDQVRELAWSAERLKVKAKVKVRHLQVSEVTHLASLVLPWVIGLIVTPPTLALLGFGGYPCVELMGGGKAAFFLTVYSLLPIGTSAAMITAATVLTLRRRRRGRLQLREALGVSVPLEDVGGGKGGDDGHHYDGKVDNSLAYVAAVAVCVVCDVCQVIRFAGLVRPHTWGYIFQAISVALDTSRSVLLPLTWLLFTDVRHMAFNTWRPQGGEADSTDASVPEGDKNLRNLQEQKALLAYHNPCTGSTVVCDEKNVKLMQ